MSSLFSTLSMLPSHLTVEMKVALYMGMEMMLVMVETSIDLFDGTLASALPSEFTPSEFASEGIQHNCNGRPYYLACSRVGNLRLGWSIIDRKHDAQRSIRSRFDLNLT